MSRIELDDRKGTALWLAGVGLVYLALSASYAFLTPPWETPDEPAHYLYTRRLAQTWRPPERPQQFELGNPKLNHEYVWYQPALGYAPGALAYALIERIAPQHLPAVIPLVRARGQPPSPYVFELSDPRIGRVWDGIEGILALRLLSSLWGLAVIGAAYRIGACLHRESRTLGIAAATAVALLPQFLFINASIRSDTVANAAAAWLLALSVSYVVAAPSSEPKRRQALQMGAWLGLGLLMKYTFIYMAATPAMAILLADRRSARLWIRSLATLAIPAGAIVGTYYAAFPQAREALGVLFGDYLPVGAEPEILSSWSRWLRVTFVESFYGRFGWNSVIGIPLRISMPCFAAWLGGALLTVVQVLRLQRRSIKSAERNGILVLGISLVVAAVAVLRLNLAELQPQGRYLFPVLSAWAVFGCWGLWQSLQPRGRILTGFAVAMGLLVMNLYGLMVRLVPTYYPAR